MTVDEALLARQNIETRQEEQQAAEAVRMAKRQEADAAAVEEMEDDMRAAKRASVIKREQEKKSLKEQAKDKAKEVAFSPVRKGSRWLLRASWLNLIDSFGMTLIYINMHLFLRWVFPDMFCRLGEEWMPKQSAVVGNEAQEYAGRAFGLVEVMGLLLLDVVAIFVILGLVMMVITIVDSILHILNIFINDPFEYLDAVHGG